MRKDAATNQPASMGQVIRALLGDFDYEIKQLSAMMGVSDDTISNLKNDHTHWTGHQNLVSLTRALARTDRVAYMRVMDMLFTCGTGYAVVPVEIGTLDADGDGSVDHLDALAHCGKAIRSGGAMVHDAMGALRDGRMDPTEYDTLDRQLQVIINEALTAREALRVAYATQPAPPRRARPLPTRNGVAS